MRFLAPFLVILAAGIARADSAGDHWKKAEDAAIGGRFSEAIDEYREGLKLRKDLGAWVTLGNVCFRAERLKEAAEAYRGALDMDPKCEPAILNLARAYDAEGDRALAIRALERALDQFPDRATLREDLALLYAQTGRLPEARTLLESSLAVAPGRAATWRALGEVLARAGEREGAIEHLETAEKMGLTDRALDRLLGDLYLALQMPIEALAAYQRVERAPGTTTDDDLFRTGRAAEEAGDDEAAIAAYRSVTARKSIDKATSMRAHAGLFRVLLRADRGDEARAVLDAVRALDPANPAVERMAGELGPKRQQ